MSRTFIETSSNQPVQSVHQWSWAHQRGQLAIATIQRPMMREISRLMRICPQGCLNKLGEIATPHVHSAAGFPAARMTQPQTLVASSTSIGESSEIPQTDPMTAGGITRSELP
jgi:hypothetical protein